VLKRSLKLVFENRPENKTTPDPGNGIKNEFVNTVCAVGSLAHFCIRHTKLRKQEGFYPSGNDP